MSSLSFEHAQQAIPELNHVDPNVSVIIIGYNTCPYSKKALAASEKLKAKSPIHRSKKVLFVGYEFGGTGEFKQKSNYRGSFPVVYLRNQHGKFDHVGGGTDLEELVNRL